MLRLWARWWYVSDLGDLDKARWPTHASAPREAALGWLVREGRSCGSS